MTAQTAFDLGPTTARRRPEQCVFLFTAAPPVRTPGTRTDWRNLTEWLTGWYAIHGRKHSSTRYRQERAHLDSLVAHRAVIEAERDDQTLAELVEVLAEMRPIRGRRDGHPTTILICWTNNRRQALR